MRRSALAVVRSSVAFCCVFAASLADVAGGVAATRSGAEIAALATAETFGYAWAHRDAPTGKSLLDFGESEGSPTAETVNAYFHGVSTPSHFAYAVETLKRQPDGEYFARLTLYAYVYDGRGKSEYPETHVVLRLMQSGSTWKIVAASGLYGE